MANPTDDRVIRDGKVAVLYSPGFGAGWYTWNRDYPQLLTHPALVAAVERGEQEKLAHDDYVKELISLPADAYLYCGGARNLEIEWVPIGAAFDVHEYDGSESLRFRDQEKWLTA